jgi:hypothetical protein
VLEALRARDLTLEQPVIAAGVRVRIAERGQERPVPLAKVVPCGALRRRGGVVGVARHERREDASPFLVGVAGERWVVRSEDLGRQVGGASRVDDPGDVQAGGLLRVALPGKEGIRHAVGTDRQTGVGSNDPRESVGVLGEHSQADEASVGICHLGVARHEPKVGQVGEAILWRPDGLHGSSSADRGRATLYYATSQKCALSIVYMSIVEPRERTRRPR